MVIVFMFVTHGLFGLFANIAVAINVAMIFGYYRCSMRPLLCRASRASC